MDAKDSHIFGPAVERQRSQTSRADQQERSALSLTTCTYNNYVPVLSHICRALRWSAF
jgi:hypothetical protein